MITYQHDPMGRRIAKKINGVAVEYYLWSGMTTLLAVYDGSGMLKQRFEYAAGRLPVRMVEGGAAYHLVYDQVGTLRAVVDGSGNVVKTVEYDSFGNVVDDSAPGFAVPFGFAGGLFDIDTGLTRFGFRDYDADVGRWTAKDPIQFAGGDSDLYGYCVGNPINLVDPDGLENIPVQYTQDGAKELWDYTYSWDDFYHDIRNTGRFLASGFISTPYGHTMSKIPSMIWFGFEGGASLDLLFIGASISGGKQVGLNGKSKTYAKACIHFPCQSIQGHLQLTSVDMSVAKDIEDLGGYTFEPYLSFGLGLFTEISFAVGPSQITMPIPIPDPRVNFGLGWGFGMGIKHCWTHQYD